MVTGRQPFQTFFSQEMKLRREDILIGAKNVTLWSQPSSLLDYMEMKSGIDSNDLLAQAIREGLTELKSGSGQKRIQEYHDKNIEALSERGKSVSRPANINDAEKSFLKDLFTTYTSITESSFISYCVSKLFDEWSPRFNRGEAMQFFEKKK